MSLQQRNQLLQVENAQLRADLQRARKALAVANAELLAETDANTWELLRALYPDLCRKLRMWLDGD